MRKITVAVVGLSFGMEFVPIYRDHPGINKVYVCDFSKDLLETAKMRYDIPEECCTEEFESLLTNPEIDAIHIVTPPATHADFSVKVLNAGKHCACTIPLGMTMDELYAVMRARKASGKNYMFMETTIYQRETLFIKEKLENGEFGKLQYMSGAHYQDMEGWPSYWRGFPPLLHPTHACAACLMFAGKRPKGVYGVGSGKIRDELAQQYGCNYAFEVALVSFEDSDLTVEVERFLYDVARGYSECFRIYGEKQSFEWQQIGKEEPVLFVRHEGIRKNGRTANISEERITIPDYAHLLPEEIRKYTKKTVYNLENKHLSFQQGGGHGGSHPYLVHEFVQSILEERRPYPDDILGAYWNAVGICAHESAMSNGRFIEIPDFESLR